MSGDLWLSFVGTSWVACISWVVCFSLFSLVRALLRTSRGVLLCSSFLVHVPLVRALAVGVVVRSSFLCRGALGSGCSGAGVVGRLAWYGVWCRVLSRLGWSVVVMGTAGGRTLVAFGAGVSSGWDLTWGSGCGNPGAGWACAGHPGRKKESGSCCGCGACVLCVLVLARGTAMGESCMRCWLEGGVPGAQGGLRCGVA